jgi:2-amino-4-hydroxy-6-hydroxymethyldihydropteridine diphosphokinase
MQPASVGLGESASRVQMPAWAEVTDRRRAHVERVTALLDRWAAQLHLGPDEARAWHDAGAWHDALRDAPAETLRALAPDATRPVETLHGPAAATRLAAEGESRVSVLEAIRWHTVGHADWDRTGRALYMADFLEPGRQFARADRAFLADHLVHDFTGVFRQVVRMRIEWTVREGKALFPETVALWNQVR